MTSAREGAADAAMFADAALAVDLALVQAVDCSSSIDTAGFRTQMGGIAAALRHPSLLKAIAAGTHRRIALTLVLWAGPNSQAVAVPWRILASDAELELAAAEIGAAPRTWPMGGTALAAALDYSSAVLARMPFPADRRIIDVSGDGADNYGGDAAAARDRALALGITINGLPIANGSRLLLTYYQTQVIGGPGAFIEPAKNILSFQETILRKLLREIGEVVS